ncbi:hypothetical protein QBE53_12975 [Vallitaleaceae bacterium 9-2]
MKHIPIMLALALSVSLTTFDDNTVQHTNTTSITETASVTINTIESNEISKQSNGKVKQ